MTSTIKTIVKSLTRLAIVWIVDALSIFLAAWILPGINVTSVGVLGAASWSLPRRCCWRS